MCCTKAFLLYFMQRATKLFLVAFLTLLIKTGFQYATAQEVFFFYKKKEENNERSPFSDVYGFFVRGCILLYLLFFFLTLRQFALRRDLYNLFLLNSCISTKLCLVLFVFYCTWQQEKLPSHFNRVQQPLAKSSSFLSVVEL